ncbi:MAG: hypothetical protein J7I99_05070 [Methanophagales archaeon]|nr:hypothetical protein [Methanophagales archaeon]
MARDTRIGYPLLSYILKKWKNSDYSKGDTTQSTPLSLIHQGNMVVGKAGATLLPASPAFYRGTRA